MTPAAERQSHPGLPATSSSSSEAGVLFLADMTAEDIEEAILRLPPAELAKFRAWFANSRARASQPCYRGGVSVLGWSVPS